MIKAYDVALPLVGMSNRTSYVIAPDGRIAWSTARWTEDHVAKSLPR